MTTRRQILIVTGMLAMPRRARAQQPERSYRLGWLGTTDNRTEPYGQAFVRRLTELGLADGRNLSTISRHSDGRLEKLPALAAELAKLKPDIFFSGGSEANLVALEQASRDTPIVFIAVDFDPVATGHVTSLARPGGRITGVTAVQSTLPAKRLEMLKELLPRTRKVAVFTNEQTTGQLAVAQDAAKRLGLALHTIDFKRPPFDYEGGFADAERSKADALFVLGSGLWVPARRKIPELALKAKLPSVFHQSQWAESGGLMSYGFSFPEMWRRGAEMVAKVLRGAKPGELPMEQPTVYELALNLKTAKALGITISPAFLTRVNKTIE
jgi:ABC-type uncharacterized transport system substrate-binding protein